MFFCHVLAPFLRLTGNLPELMQGLTSLAWFGQKENRSIFERLGYAIGAVFPAVKMSDHLLVND
ncbi:TPA: hypothetical protein ACGO9C_001324 [Streptococcus suis]